MKDIVTPPTRGFADDEFRQRTAKAQSLMAEAGLAGLLLMSEQEVRVEGVTCCNFNLIEIR